MLHLLPPLFRSGKGKAKADAPRPLVPLKINAFAAAKPAGENSCSVTAAAERLLSKAVTFGESGYGSSISRFGGRTHIEWLHLSVSRISTAAVTETDELGGISGRYYVHLRCDAHRRWNAKDQEWTAWDNGNYAIFPSVILVERIHGRCHARAEGLENFSPGNPKSRTVENFGMEIGFAV